MAKKFGKFLLVTAAASAAVAGVYYYLKSKDQLAVSYDADEDYDDFSEDEEDLSRTYTTLDLDAPGSTVAPAPESTNASDSTTALSSESTDAPAVSFSSLADQVTLKTEEQVEEFFDDDNIDELQ